MYEPMDIEYTKAYRKTSEDRAAHERLVNEATKSTPKRNTVLLLLSLSLIILGLGFCLWPLMFSLIP